ncbi:MAG: hypothetical protein AABX54_02370 [Nanoarchaeota archaeon]
MEKEFKFKSFFFWQPSIWQKTSLSNFENNINSTDRKSFDEDYIDITKRLKKEKEVIDISDALNGINKTLFIDEGHLSKEGNILISEKIGENIVAYLKSGKNKF